MSSRHIGAAPDVIKAGMLYGVRDLSSVKSPLPRATLSRPSPQVPAASAFASFQPPARMALSADQAAVSSQFDAIVRQSPLPRPVMDRRRSSLGGGGSDTAMPPPPPPRTAERSGADAVSATRGGAPHAPGSAQEGDAPRTSPLSKRIDAPLAGAELTGLGDDEGSAHRLAGEGGPRAGDGDAHTREQPAAGAGPSAPPAPAAAPKGQVVTLTRWYPKVLPPHLRLPAGAAPIAVEGLRIDPKSGNEQERWHSSAIATRQSATELLTSSGSLYVLQGPLDAVLCTQRVDAPDASILAAFADGFPESWRELSAAATQQHGAAKKGPPPIAAENGGKARADALGGGGGKAEGANGRGKTAVAETVDSPAPTPKVAAKAKAKAKATGNGNGNGNENDNGASASAAKQFQFVHNSEEIQQQQQQQSAVKAGKGRGSKTQAEGEGEAVGIAGKGGAGRGRVVGSERKSAKRRAKAEEEEEEEGEAAATAAGCGKAKAAPKGAPKGATAKTGGAGRSSGAAREVLYGEEDEEEEEEELPLTAGSKRKQPNPPKKPLKQKEKAKEKGKSSPKRARNAGPPAAAVVVPRGKLARSPAHMLSPEGAYTIAAGAQSVAAWGQAVEYEQPSGDVPSSTTRTGRVCVRPLAFWAQQMCVTGMDGKTRITTGGVDFTARIPGKGPPPAAPPAPQANRPSPAPPTAPGGGRGGGGGGGKGKGGGQAERGGGGGKGSGQPTAKEGSGKQAARGGRGSKSGKECAWGNFEEDEHTGDVPTDTEPFAHNDEGSDGQVGGDGLAGEMTTHTSILNKDKGGLGVV
ncbi:hypothetical protein T492DRAFT_845109 [Pavlovales sp. CCMP2436]|nr:hypothetical protein T492DRAFT_845109 [Pavlovales sp. CCMP2436]